MNRQSGESSYTGAFIAVTTMLCLFAIAARRAAVAHGSGAPLAAVVH